MNMQEVQIYTCLFVSMVSVGCFASKHAGKSATTPMDSSQTASDAASDVTGEDASFLVSTGGIGGKLAEQIDAGHPKDTSAGADSEDKGKKDSGALFPHIDAASDAPDTFFDGDAGPTPPPYCVAPCVWEVIRHCIPTLDTCVTDIDPPDGGPVFYSMTCDPNTGWAKFFGFVALHEYEESVRLNNITCFRWDHLGVPGYSPTHYLYNSSGGKVATYSEDTVYCGDVAPVYNMDRSRSECAAWDETGLPVAPPCRTTRSGTCP